MDYAVGPAPQGGDRNRASEILAIDGVIFSISWSMVFLRVCTRMWITRNLGWDDATIVLAAVCTLKLQVLRQQYLPEPSR